MGSMPAVGDWQKPNDIDLEALIIGGGFSGLYSLYKLRQTGIDAKIFEASKELGGVWNYNRYPGARVDSEVPYYQFNVREIWETFYWSERFPGDEELRKYFHHMATVLGLYDHIAFDQNVAGCDYDATKNHWVVKTAAGKTVRCKYLIVAAGSSYKTHMPTFEGLDQYTGTCIHAATFPQEGFDFSGKNVAIVGQGTKRMKLDEPH